MVSGCGMPAVCPQSTAAQWWGSWFICGEKKSWGHIHNGVQWYTELYSLAKQQYTTDIAFFKIKKKSAFPLVPEQPSPEPQHNTKPKKSILRCQLKRSYISTSQTVNLKAARSNEIEIHACCDKDLPDWLYWLGYHVIDLTIVKQTQLISLSKRGVILDIAFKMANQPLIKYEVNLSAFPFPTRFRWRINGLSPWRRTNNTNITQAVYAGYT